MATAEANDLITEVTQLPVQPGAAMRLLWMLEDPRTSAADLGRLIESDPALSTQVIRLANTAFYGLSGKVSSAWRAVTVLGLATVRAIATTAAFDLFSEKGRSVPDDFWPHSVTTAAAAAALARRVGIQPNDAFSAGLLHDLGSALVFRRAPRRYDAVLDLLANDFTLARLDAERQEFGMTHADVGAAALSVMRFPVEMVEAILKDQKRILPCAAYLEGEYGIQGLYVGVPVKLGAKGVEQVIEIKLTPEEKAALDRSAGSVRELVNIMKL